MLCHIYLIINGSFWLCREKFLFPAPIFCLLTTMWILGIGNCILLCAINRKFPWTFSIQKVGLILNQLNFCSLELVTGSLKEWLEMRVSHHHYSKSFLCCLFCSSFHRVAVKHIAVIPFEMWEKWKESAFKYSIPRNISVARTQAWSSNRAQSVLDFSRVTFPCIVGLGLKWNLKCVGPLGPVRGLKDRFASGILSTFILFWWETKKGLLLDWLDKFWNKNEDRFCWKYG